jgi:DNA-binding GntR family transcriptional regulator
LVLLLDAAPSPSDAPIGGIDNAGYLAFFEALVTGKLRLGQTLTQEELCDILGMSLSPMRETTTLLEAEGMITVRRKVGITIFYPDVRFIGNTFQLRGLLEKEGLRKFTRTATDAWLRKARQDHMKIIDYVRAVNDQSVFRLPMRALESEFHGSFIAAYDNDQISVIYGRLAQKMYLIRLHNMEAVGPANSVKSMEEHLAVIDAIEGVLHRVLTT